MRRLSGRTGRAVRRPQRVGGGDINEAYKVQFEDESFAFVKTRATSRPASTPPRPRACAGSPSRARCACPRCSASATSVLVLDWVDEGAARRRGRVRRRASPDPRGRAPTTSAARTPLRVGPLLLPNDSVPDWPSSTPRAACSRCSRAPGSARGNARSSRSATGSRPRRSARAAGAPARRPLERQRPLGPRRARLADRPGRLRRPSRGRPGDAAALRQSRAGTSSPPTRSASRSPPATRSASRSTSCSRCSCTPRCSAAATRPRPSARPVRTPPRAGRRPRTRSRCSAACTRCRSRCTARARSGSGSRCRWCGS